MAMLFHLHGCYVCMFGVLIVVRENVLAAGVQIPKRCPGSIPKHTPGSKVDGTTAMYFLSLSKTWGVGELRHFPVRQWCMCLFLNPNVYQGPCYLKWEFDLRSIHKPWRVPSSECCSRRPKFWEKFSKRILVQMQQTNHAFKVASCSKKHLAIRSKHGNHWKILSWQITLMRSYDLRPVFEAWWFHHWSR